VFHVAQTAESTAATQCVIYTGTDIVG